MEKIRSIHLQRLHKKMGEIVYELTKVQYSMVSPEECWKPAINAYRCPDGLTICVDLAGVEKSQLDLQVWPQKLILRGYRQSPEPGQSEGKPLQILAMEIDSGSFKREIAFPFDVDPDRTTAEQRNGMLWIRLPLRSQA